jgi:hypothetical protein
MHSTCNVPPAPARRLSLVLLARNTDCIRFLIRSTVSSRHFLENRKNHRRTRNNRVGSQRPCATRNKTDGIGNKKARSDQNRESELRQPAQCTLCSGPCTHSMVSCMVRHSRAASDTHPVFGGFPKPPSLSLTTSPLCSTHPLPYTHPQVQRQTHASCSGHIETPSHKFE